MRFTEKYRTMKDHSNHFHGPVLRGIFFESKDWRFDGSTPIFAYCVLRFGYYGRIASVLRVAYCGRVAGVLRACCGRVAGVLRAYRLLPESVEVLHQPEKKGQERKRTRKE